MVETQLAGLVKIWMETEVLESSPAFPHYSWTMSLSAQANQQSYTIHASTHTDYKIIAKFA